MQNSAKGFFFSLICLGTCSLNECFVVVGFIFFHKMYHLTNLKKEEKTLMIDRYLKNHLIIGWVKYWQQHIPEISFESPSFEIELYF